MLIKVKVFPAFKKEEIIKKAEDRLELKIKEKAELGLANAGAIRILSEYFKVPKNKIRIIRGHKQRSKIIEIAS